MWWGSINVICFAGMQKYAFSLSFLFWPIAVFAILGIYSIGPLGKGFKEAIVADEKEEKEACRVRQPWE